MLAIVLVPVQEVEAEGAKNATMHFSTMAMMVDQQEQVVVVLTTGEATMAVAMVVMHTMMSVRRQGEAQIQQQSGIEMLGRRSGLTLLQGVC